MTNPNCPLCEGLGKIIKELKAVQETLEMWRPLAEEGLSEQEYFEKVGILRGIELMG